MKDKLPQHIAIIPDGNRRWSKLHGVPALQGHRRGAERMHAAVDQLIDLGVKYLTLWGFSIDNWKRSQDEISSLFRLLSHWLERDTAWLKSRSVRIHHIGRTHELPEFLQLAIKRAVELTSGNTSMTLNLAFNYSGRAEIVDAVRRLLSANIEPSTVDENLFKSHLYTEGMPDVDLVIRTAGEFRLSNFLLWQAAYSELYFTPAFWPDFDAKELEKALETYSERQRRFGGD